MGTLNEFLDEKRIAVRTLRRSAVEDPTAKLMQARCRVLGRSGIREVRIRDFQIVTDTPPYFAGCGLGVEATEVVHPERRGETVVTTRARCRLPRRFPHC